MRDGSGYEFFDLFSGIGGFALGLERSGIAVSKHYYSEIDPYASQVYQKRFPESQALGDIKKVDFERLKEESKSDIIITGGFPCQNLSRINTKGSKKGLKGDKSGLWYNMYEAIRFLRPKIVIIENVSDLLKRGLNELLIGFAQIRYNVEWDYFRASEFSLPHRRQRLFIIAYPSCFRFQGITSKARKFKKVNVDQDALWYKKVYKIDLHSPSFWAEYKGNFTSLRRGHGVPYFEDRIRCLGNAVIPHIVETIFKACIDTKILS